LTIWKEVVVRKTIVFDRDGTIIGIADAPADARAQREVLPPRPIEGHTIVHLDIPVEHEEDRLEELANNLRVDTSGETPRLIAR
jgi:hypothetical protein